MIQHYEVTPRSESDPITAALEAVGAELVSAQDFPLLNEWGDMATHLAGNNFVVWVLPGSTAGTLEHEWALGTRLGPEADGSASQWLKTPPPAFREASL